MTERSVRLSPVGGTGSKASSPTTEPLNTWTDWQQGMPSSSDKEHFDTDKFGVESASKPEMYCPATSVSATDDNKDKTGSHTAASVSAGGDLKNYSFPANQEMDSRQTSGSLSGDKNSNNKDFLSSSKTDWCQISGSSLSASGRVLVDKQTIPTSDKTDMMMSATSSSPGLEKMELTFSPLQELLERSDLSVSTMGAPGQDPGEFILEFLRQRTLEKRQLASSRGGNYGGSLADSGIEPSKAGQSRQGVSDTSSASSLLRSKHSREGAGGDASVQGRLKNPKQNSDKSYRYSDFPKSSFSEIHHKNTQGLSSPRTAEELENFIPQADEHGGVFGDEARKTSANMSSFFRDQTKDGEEDRTLGLKDLTLSESSVFKVPLPISSSKTVNSKVKPSPFRSKIPLQIARTSPAPPAGPSDYSLSVSARNKPSLQSGRLPISKTSSRVNTEQPSTQSDFSNAKQSAAIGDSNPVVDTGLTRSQPIMDSSTLDTRSDPQTADTETLRQESGSSSDKPKSLPNFASSELNISRLSSQLKPHTVSSDHNRSSSQERTNRGEMEVSSGGHQLRSPEHDGYLAGMTSSLDTLTEESILHTMLSTSDTSLMPLVTPRSVVDLVKVPDTLSMPEPCCVSLSTAASLTVTNLLPRGIKCGFVVRAVTVTLDDGRRQNISPSRCPFDFKREITLAPRGSENIQVIFQPKGQGVFSALVEVTAATMSDGEKRIYTVTITGTAEFPTLEMWPASEKIDFGDLMCGASRCKSIRIKNVGRVTVPLCFSLFRTDSSPGMFSFYPESLTSDVSSISLTSRPSGAADVTNGILSMSLPGRVEGQEVKTETVKIYCNTQAFDKRDQHRYLARADKFHARLQVCVDQPVEELAPLASVSLRVNIGLYKLQVDTSELTIPAWPSSSGTATVKLFNTGSISMPVRVFFEASNHQFSVNPSGDILVPPSDGNKKGCVPVSVSFTPQLGSESRVEDASVNLMFGTEVSDHYIPVTGKLQTTHSAYHITKAPTVKLSASTMHISFGGVQIGHSGKEKWAFTVDSDVVVSISVRQTGQAFMLLDPCDEVAKESVELSAARNKKQMVWVVFEPTTVAWYSASLILLDPIGKRYTIPVSGYGGCSSVHLERVNLAHTETSFWLDMGHLSTGHSIFKKFVVRNQGSRCSFVRASFCDANRSEFMPTRATVMPSSLILQPGEAKELLAMFCPSEKEVALCRTGHALVGIIKLEHGDNIGREMFL
ncbi:centrosomal protein of 192 kDa, partial [Elysia marginata]